MSAFITGLIVLFIATAIFYIVLFSFIYYWHLRKISFIVVPAVFAFEFFATCFFIVAIISIIIDFLPSIIRASGI